MLLRYLLTINALCLLSFSNVIAQPSRDSLRAVIVNMGMEVTNPGLQDEYLLQPLYQELKRIFHLKEIGFSRDNKIHWATIENPFNTIKKLNKKDREKLSTEAASLFIKIEVVHEYNDLLAGLIPKSKKHVMIFKCAVFDNTGDRIWYMRKKVSDYIQFGVDDEVAAESVLTPVEFTSLYTDALKETFGKF